MEPLIANGEILNLSNNVVQPFYAAKSKQAQEWMHHYFDDSLPYRIHKSEGALFLWVHFEGLPISSKQLYQRLKERGVLIISGHYFFFGLGQQWRHQEECIRVTYSMQPDVVESGIRIIAEEIERAYREAA